MNGRGKRGPPWTRKKFDAVWAQFKSGVPVTQLAEENGCTVSNIYRRLRIVGYSPKDEVQKRRRVEMSSSRIYTMRKQGKEFGAIAVALGMEPSAATTRKLYMRLVQYCKKAGVPYPHMPPPPRKRKPRRLRGRAALTGADLTHVIVALRTIAAPSRPVGNTELAAALGVPIRQLGAMLAELRRRKVLADGLTPTHEGVAAAAKQPSSRTCADEVLERVVTAWTTGEPCETLGSLVDQLAYCRSTINVSIISLRERGLLHPRGSLILRENP